MSATKYCIDCSEPFDIPGVRCAACVEAEELDAQNEAEREAEISLDMDFLREMEEESEYLRGDYEDSCFFDDEDHEDLDEIFRRAEEQAERYEDFEE